MPAAALAGESPILPASWNDFRMHPLRLICLSSWSGLFILQLSLLLPGYQIDLYWILLLTLPLLLPLPGLWHDRLYTYRWVGFMMLLYFCVGISELVANPALQTYALGTTICSILLFLTSIYYARLLGIRNQNS